MRLYGKVDSAIDNNDRPLFMGGIFSRRFHDEFPTLSIGQSFNNATQDSAVDPTIRSEFENGVVLSRARFTTLKKKFSRTYILLNAADVILLENLQTSIKIGAATFFWTNPDDSIEYEVRLMRSISFSTEPRNFSYHNARLEMAQQ